jgi:ribulose-phosphate 3-epimerase
MIEIIPAILEKSYEEIKNKVATVRGLVSTVQIDLCDGVFVPSTTWPYGRDLADDTDFAKIMEGEEGLPYWEDMDFEVDLLVKNAHKLFDKFLKLGPKSLIFHYEAEDKDSFKDFLESIDPYVRDTVEIGLAINPSTPIEEASSLLNNIDFILCMGNDKIGYQGVTLDEKVYPKIKDIKEKYPDMPVEVDIGVNEKTAPLLVEAGATKLVAGSAVFKAENIKQTIENFRNLG